MQKFKVGDKVKVVDEEKMLDHFMPEEAIRVGTVSVVCTEEPAVKLLEDSDKWWYPMNCLAPVEEPMKPKMPLWKQHARAAGEADLRIFVSLKQGPTRGVFLRAMWAVTYDRGMANERVYR